MLTHTFEYFLSAKSGRGQPDAQCELTAFFFIVLMNGRYEPVEQ
jgi:hypothetical protein